MNLLSTLKVNYICPKCNFVRPEHLTTKTCPTCGKSLKMIFVEEKPSVPGACEMVNCCPVASPNCYIASPVPANNPQGARDATDWATSPERRWLYCTAGYKQHILGLSFLKSLGISHLIYCPVCNANLEQYLIRSRDERIRSSKRKDKL